ncbi:hypothetical protein [Geomicrobium sp. JCM 19039]|uniref:hypothetical protein n=1 Tax=Geomicrobium sp. JCM 19039 TaxID=1460636 RepID=UPI00045F4378|nr:hypothetical protein [Geomicrobium sp. JCM 19039]GAK13368.1 hypothetical protein JCM19039_3210 [Geomicrobium sp. JCM 19039]
MHVYHVYGPHENNDGIHRALREGMTSQTISKWNSRGGGALFPHLIKKVQRGSTDDWMDFGQSFAIHLSAETFKNDVRFPYSSDRIIAFNIERTVDLFAYIEEEGMGSEYTPGMFTDHLPSKQRLMEQYWNSRMTLADYLLHKPYKEAEYICFDYIPPYLIEGYINQKKWL